MVRVYFKLEENIMKKVLLTTTAVVFTAGFASAGDMSMSGAIKLTYGGFGTGSIAGADNAFTSEADLDVAASSSSGSFSVSGLSLIQI